MIKYKLLNNSLNQAKPNMYTYSLKGKQEVFI